VKRLRVLWPARERMVSTFGPIVLAIVVLGLFVLPNYLHAAEARRESARVDFTANEQLLKRSQLVALERDLAERRAERTMNCRTLLDIGSDRLAEAIGRTIDGRGIRNQGVRLGSPERLPKDAHRPLDLVRRSVTVEMMGSFDAAFSLIDAAESISQLVVPYRIEIQLVRGNPDDEAAIRAAIEFHGYFRAPGAEP